MSFYQSSIFFGNEDIGIMFWNNGTQSEIRQKGISFGANNLDETESSVISSAIVYML